MLRTGTSTIDLNSTAITASGDVLIDATTVTDAATEAIAVKDSDDESNSSTLGKIKEFADNLSVGYSEANSESTTTLSNSVVIDAVGDVTIMASATTNAEITSSTSSNTSDEDDTEDVDNDGVKDPPSPADTSALAVSYTHLTLPTICSV